MTNTLSTNELRTPTVTPAVDIYQNADELLLVADLPGVSKDGLEIHYERGHISIKGRPAPAADAGKLLYGARERPTYARSFAIPGTIDVTRIAAELDAGVLRLRLPKMDQAKPRQIPIATGR
jgi:HSP20 family molecular chaperone IbpA